MELAVIKPGLLTTIQDRGRWGFQARGVPVAGPMDPRSHRVANALVGNDPGAAALEVTLIGPEIQFDDERRVAVAGAAFELWLDDRPIPCGIACRVSAGSRLRVGSRVRGSRAYVAISGGIAVPPVLGSRSTHVISRMGGMEGRALIRGDRVPLGATQRIQRKLDPPSSIALTIPDRHARVRVLPGPHLDRFAENALDALQSTPYRIASESDRMGFRLEGPGIVHTAGADIISDAMPLGAIQVPASGQPVLLMADRQTTGGYPAIAAVISADFGLAGQLGPGDTIAFDVCTRRDAMAALIVQERALMAIESRVPR